MHLETAHPILTRRRPWPYWRARLRHFRHPGDLRTFLHLGLALWCLPVALSVLGLPRLLARLAAVGRPAPAISLARAQVLARYADFWLRRWRPHNPCLRRSLVLFGRLRRGGLPVTFCLGIGRDAIGAGDQPVTGHAWLELAGQVILEPTAVVSTQVRTFCYPPSPAVPGPSLRKTTADPVSARSTNNADWPPAPG